MIKFLGTNCRLPARSKTSSGNRWKPPLNELRNRTGELIRSVSELQALMKPRKRSTRVSHQGSSNALNTDGSF